MCRRKLVVWRADPDERRVVASELHEPDGESVGLHHKVEQPKVPPRRRRGRAQRSAPNRNVVEGPRSVDLFKDVVHLKSELVDPGQEVAFHGLTSWWKNAIDAHPCTVSRSVFSTTERILAARLVEDPHSREAA